MLDNRLYLNKQKLDNMITEIKHIILKLNFDVEKNEFIYPIKGIDKLNSFLITANGFLYGNKFGNFTKHLIIIN